MKRVLIGAALLLAGTLSTAPSASATPYSFLQLMHQNEFWSTGGDQGLLNLGYWVCTQLNAGWTPAATAAAINKDNTFPDGNEGKFAAMAVTELCPAHRNQGFNQSLPMSYGSSV